MDPSQLERWVTTHDSLEGAGPGPLPRATRSRRSCAWPGKSFKVDWRSVEADGPRLARWEGDGPAGSTANVVYRLEDEDGGTRFDYENEFALPGGALGKAAGGAALRGAGRARGAQVPGAPRALLESSRRTAGGARRPPRGGGAQRQQRIDEHREHPGADQRHRDLRAHRSARRNRTRRRRDFSRRAADSELHLIGTVAWRVLPVFDSPASGGLAVVME